ncbi:MAG: hypothetical protein PHC34_01955 [Candidatus Gastranaerophilales bacterium]|nr:hypothetical protein [Candidatus Gastranaerophilales bacterium]
MFDVNYNVAIINRNYSMQINSFKNNIQPNYKQAKTKKTQVSLSFSGFPEYLAEKIPEGFLKNKNLHNYLKLAENNASMFEEIITFILGVFLRPAAILAVPGAKKEDKKYPAVKSIASSLISFGLTALVYIPLARHIRKLGTTAVKNVSKSGSFPYKEGTKQFDSFNYLVNYGSIFIVAPLQTVLLFKAIPPLMDKLFPKKDNKDWSTSMFLNNSQQELFKNFIRSDKQ